MLARYNFCSPLWDNSWEWDTIIYKILFEFVLTILADHATRLHALFRCHFYLGVRFLLVSFFASAGWCVGVTVSCDENVGDVGEDELEELVDRTKTTNGT